MILGFDFCLRTDDRCYGSVHTIFFFFFSYSFSSFIKSVISYLLGTCIGQVCNKHEIFQVMCEPRLLQKNVCSPEHR